MKYLQTHLLFQRTFSFHSPHIFTIPPPLCLTMSAHLGSSSNAGHMTALHDEPTKRTSPCETHAWRLYNTNIKLIVITNTEWRTRSGSRGMKLAKTAICDVPTEWKLGGDLFFFPHG
uniref:Uncharacterized protein n=1 Tax=Sphaerodactylus townsendi TaxID=933632 RepID=A0ACB8F065_9SAUR